MTAALAMLAAVLLDALLGEPRRAHPLVAFGRLAVRIESRRHADRRAAGVAAWCAAVLPAVAAAWLLCRWLPGWAGALFSAAVLYLASDAARHVTGTALELGAGASALKP